jgi:hypothetical protein
LHGDAYIKPNSAGFQLVEIQNTDTDAAVDAFGTPEKKFILIDQQGRLRHVFTSAEAKNIVSNGKKASSFIPENLIKLKNNDNGEVHNFRRKEIKNTEGGTVAYVYIPVGGGGNKAYVKINDKYYGLDLEHVNDVNASNYTNLASRENEKDVIIVKNGGKIFKHQYGTKYYGEKSGMKSSELPLEDELVRTRLD